MEKKIKHQVFVILTIFLLPFSIFGDNHNKQNNCPEDDIATLYDLIYGNYLPFEPPLDEEGNVSLSPEEWFVMKSKHFFNQISTFKQKGLPILIQHVFLHMIALAKIVFNVFI